LPVKVKFTLEKATKTQRGSTLPSTSALDGVGVQRHSPAALPPRKTGYPLYRRLGGPHGRSGRVRKTPTPTGIRSPDRPARIESLYRQRYPAPIIFASADDILSYYNFTVPKAEFPRPNWDSNVLLVSCPKAECVTSRNYAKSST
jgi:hypothetical protein